MIVLGSGRGWSRAAVWGAVSSVLGKVLLGAGVLIVAAALCRRARALAGLAGHPKAGNEGDGSRRARRACIA